MNYLHVYMCTCVYAVSFSWDISETIRMYTVAKQPLPGNIQALLLCQQLAWQQMSSIVRLRLQFHTKQILCVRAGGGDGVSGEGGDDVSGGGGDGVNGEGGDRVNGGGGDGVNGEGGDRVNGGGGDGVNGGDGDGANDGGGEMSVGVCGDGVKGDLCAVVMMGHVCRVLRECEEETWREEGGRDGRSEYSRD